MYQRFVLAMLATAILVAGCAQDSTSTNLANTGGASNSITPGEDAYTIGLMAFYGQDHSDQANYYLQLTREQAGWKDLSVVHMLGRSVLYVGRYPTQAQAQAALETVRKWKTKAGIQPYKDALVTELPGYEPGPAKWNLKNVDGTYSIVVAVFYDEPENNFTGRKQAAVSCCEGFRKEGEEAYFIHGPVKSSVCIGVFPENAVVYTKVQGVDKPNYQDPRIEKILLRHPYMAENWLIRERQAPSIDKGWTNVKPQSYLFRIPREITKSEPDPFRRPGDTQRRKNP